MFYTYIVIGATKTSKKDLEIYYVKLFVISA